MLVDNCQSKALSQQETWMLRLCFVEAKKQSHRKKLLNQVNNNKIHFLELLPSLLLLIHSLTEPPRKPIRWFICGRLQLDQSASSDANQFPRLHKHKCVNTTILHQGRTEKNSTNYSQVSKQETGKVKYLHVLPRGSVPQTLSWNNKWLILSSSNVLVHRLISLRNNRNPAATHFKPNPAFVQSDF